MTPGHTLAIATLSLGCIASPAVAGDPAQQAAGSPSLDDRVEAFLDSRRGTWRDLNVPEEDGRRLYELIVEHGFRNAVEIGTSTGHSAVWMAWALSKTGGELTTIEIDERRHRIARANFEKAGLADVVDARLGDAHELVPRLEGPLDFIFSDADKEWYTRYFVSLWPKLSVGGCFTAHNVLSDMSGIEEFLDHLETVPNAETTIDRSSSSGISITCKTAAQ